MWVCENVNSKGVMDDDDIDDENDEQARTK